MFDESQSWFLFYSIVFICRKRTARFEFLDVNNASLNNSNIVLFYKLDILLQCLVNL